MTKPNFFLVGAPKCGTTAIAQYLAEREDVYFSKPKEPLFWCTDLGIEPHALRAATLAEYQALFAAANPARHKIIGEGTTAYLRSPNALRQCLDYAPDARFLAILRNPVDVAHAFHMEQLYTGLETQSDFAAAWADQPRREAEWEARRPNAPDSLLYRRIAAFAGQIQCFYNTVPAPQRKVVLFDDLRDHAPEVWSDILSFLHLPQDGRTDFPHRNTAHAQRFPRLSHALLSPPKPLAPAVRAMRKTLLANDIAPVRALKRVLNVKRPRPALEAGIRAEMTAYFRPDIERLETLLDRDLAHWKRAG